MVRLWLRLYIYIYIERDYHIRVYLSFIQHKNLDIICILEVIFKSKFDIGIGFKASKLVYLRLFEMNRSQTCRGSRFYVGSVKVVCCNNSLLAIGYVVN